MCRPLVAVVDMHSWLCEYPCSKHSQTKLGSMFVNPSVNPSINQSSNRSINRSVTRSIKRSIIGNPWGISGDFWLGIHSLGEVQIQTEHIHTHAISLTKPRFPFHVLTGFWMTFWRILSPLTLPDGALAYTRRLFWENHLFRFRLDFLWNLDGNWVQKECKNDSKNQLKNQCFFDWKK